MADNNLPKVYVDRVTLESASDADSSGLRSSVSFYVRHEIGHTDIIDWVTDPKLTQNLKIILLQSTNKQSTEQIQALAAAGQTTDIDDLDGVTKKEISISESGITSLSDFDGYVLKNAEKYDPVADRDYSLGKSSPVEGFIQPSEYNVPGRPETRLDAP